METDDGVPPTGEGEGASEGGSETAPALEGATDDAADGDGSEANGGSDAPATRTEGATDGEDAAADRATSASGEDAAADGTEALDSGPRVAVGEYTWADFLAEHGAESDVETLYRGYDPRERRGDSDDEESGGRWDDGDEESGGRWDDGDAVEIPTPNRTDWAGVGVDPEAYLDFHPAETRAVVKSAARAAARHDAAFEAFCDPATTPVVKGEWLWEHYKREYYYNDDGSRPRGADGEIEDFDAESALGFDPDAIEKVLAHGAQRAEELEAVVDERTVNVDPEFDEDAFFSDTRGATTVVNRYDLEKSVPLAKKSHFREVERYWVNEPHAFVIIFHSTKENEKKYYVIQPHQTPIETDLVEFLTGKLRTAIKYDDDSVVSDAPGTRRRTIEQQALELLERYNLYSVPEDPRAAGLSILPSRSSDDEDGVLAGLDLDLGVGSDEESAEPSPDRSERTLAKVARSLGLSPGVFGGRLDGLFDDGAVGGVDPSLDGISARPEPAVLEEDSADLNDYQVEKLLYALRRDFIGYERIDGIKHDVNVEDISCDGYNSRVFVYHSDYEQIISNVSHGEDELDDFVVKLAQRSGKGISKRRPQVDATLPDGSRAQLTLGREVSDHGTNYTIRQFKDVPFTPVDLINWKTFSLEEMAFLWLCIENDKSLIFAGGTASGKTTSLNAVSLFIPSNAKIVSIEDTREVELPQRNWVASVTRPSFSDDDGGDVDEFDLLEAALRQRPDYIVMGEIRGEEGRTLFQVMSTGHTTYTTFHADSVGEVLKRFTTDPINVSKTMFTALDLVSIQTSTRVQGDKVRRNKSLTEINHYDAENDEINVQDVYQWQAEGDEFLKMGSSNTLEDIKFDRGWTHQELNEEQFKRRVVLAYLIDRGLNTYTQVAATLQAFINDEETILALMAREELERSLEDLREMESVKIDVDPEKEEMVPRPTPGEEVQAVCDEILQRAEDELWPDYRDLEDVDVADALVDVDSAPDVAATGGERHELDALDERAEPPTDGAEPSALEGDSTPATDPGDATAGETPTGNAADAATADTDDAEGGGNDDVEDGDAEDDAGTWEIVDDEDDEDAGDAVNLFEQFDEGSTEAASAGNEFRDGDGGATSGTDADERADADREIGGDADTTAGTGGDAGESPGAGEGADATAGTGEDAEESPGAGPGDGTPAAGTEGDDGATAVDGDAEADPWDASADPWDAEADTQAADTQEADTQAADTQEADTQAADSAAATDDEPAESVGIEELLEEADGADSTDEGSTWDGSGFKPVDPNDEDGDADGDQAASDGGGTTDRAGEPGVDADSEAAGDDERFGDDVGDAPGGDR